MFLGMFQWLSTTLRRDQVITGVVFTKDGHQSIASIQGLSNDEVALSVKAMMRLGYRPAGITTRKLSFDEREPAPDGYKPFAAYLKA